VGISVAKLAYDHLILPNRALLPDLQNAGNELWLAILAFLYAVANKVPLPSGPGAGRRNTFVRVHYHQAVFKFGGIISEKIGDELLRLLTYSILSYEDYARPPAIRSIERLMFWKEEKTTGIMQVQGQRNLGDEESVSAAADILSESWHRHEDEDHPYTRVSRTIGDYNKDVDYISRVLEVMEIIAKRIEPVYEPAYRNLWGE